MNFVALIHFQGARYFHFYHHIYEIWLFDIELEFPEI